jgi:hypothetical protein
MREGFPNLIETPEEIKKGTGQGLRDQLREKLLDFLDPVLGKLFDIKKEIRKDFIKLIEEQEDAEYLSSEAGKFFRSLIPDGLRKTEIEGVPYVGSNNWIMLCEHEERLKLLKKEVGKLSRKEYREGKRGILKDSIHSGGKVAAEGEIIETEGVDGAVEQMMVNIWGQDGNKNIIYERVSNTLNRPRNTNQAVSSLVIQDVESGVTLDLNALLPSNYKYVPRIMDKDLYQPDPENTITGMSYKQKEIADLKDYKMGVSAPEGFAVRPFCLTVDYGDLRKTGGILSLLHEVAHSWQDIYYNTTEQGKFGFESLYKTVVSLINKLDIPKDSEQHEDPEKIWEKLEKGGIICLDKNGLEDPLNEEGVINIPNTYYDIIRLIESFDLSDSRFSPQQREQAKSVLVKSKLLLRFYPIKSDVLQKVMNTYVAEERDAWAHAIKTVIFLRSKGIDVEPKLKNLEDFKVVIDPCLASYQNSLEMTILNQKTGYRFSKIPK